MSIYLLYLQKIYDKMKKINELTERFGKWFFRIKNTGVAGGEENKYD